MKNRKTNRDIDDGRRSNIPPWLLNADLVAPCRCGKPLIDPTEVAIAIEKTTGLKRWWHAECWMIYSQSMEDNGYEG